MSKFLCKTILLGSRIVRPSPTSNLSFLLRWISRSSHEESFTVSYLRNSLGFSPEDALHASRYVNFETPEKPDKFINLFKKYGFTLMQISTLVRVMPNLLYLDAEKIISPKLEFLKAKGISGPQMAKLLSVYPNILGRSLANQIMPSYDYMRNLFKSDDMLSIAIKRNPDILKYNIEKHVSPKVDILREHGVPDSKIATLMQRYPKTFTASLDGFRKIVEKVEGMGFDASKFSFVLAVVAIWMTDESRWQSKINAYKRWGWSEEDVFKAFKRSPWCMIISEDKLMAGMDFFINQMCWRPCLVAENPVILTLSLKNRIVPRCSVFQVLVSKGLVKKKVSIHALLLVSEEKFLQKFVVPYEKEAPKLLKLYKEKLDLSSGSDSDENI